MCTKTADALPYWLAGEICKVNLCLNAFSFMCRTQVQYFSVVISKIHMGIKTHINIFNVKTFFSSLYYMSLLFSAAAASGSHIQFSSPPCFHSSELLMEAEAAGCAWQ